METIKAVIRFIPGQIIFVAITIVITFIFYLFFQYFLKKWFTTVRIFVKEIKIPFMLLYEPIRFLFPPVCFLIAMSFISVPDNIKTLINQLLVVWFIAGMAWLSIRIITIFRIIVLSRYKLNVKDNLKARQMNTQIMVVQRILIAVISLLAISAILMTFDKVRQVGLSIMASAGIAGIIIGLAAQRSLAALIAGIQIAITQPIRIEDVVIVDNEWGWIEEITLTYVIVRIWDQRRLVVPIMNFIEKSFQNWTRTTSELLGAIYLYADYGIPVDELRHELINIVNNSPLWDKRVAKIEVTNLSEKTMEMRALISAEDSSNAWDLRCLVRERLITFMQRNYPDYLPHVRLNTEKKGTDVTE